MGSKALFYLLVTAALVGAVVLLFKTNYRRDYNLVSNRDFYSGLAQH